ncbi:MAG: macro domain-containing protein, partial [Lachnospiraceae bacterium]|nr:macro domain-containing protein [Lachnospiraceae bacterium]
MSFRIIRNDITKMPCDAIVNTAGMYPVDTFDEVGAGCDKAIHKAAGADELIAARKKIGVLSEGEAAITPGFALPAKYIIHAVSPIYIDGNSGEEEKLRNCYRNSLRLALENGVKTIAFPLIATGSFGY